jgi:hypothetical protein
LQLDVVISVIVDEKADQQDDGMYTTPELENTCVARISNAISNTSSTELFNNL